MKNLIVFIGLLAGWFVIGSSLAFIDWLAQFEFLGWLALTGLIAAPIYLAIKFWRSI